MYQIHLLVMIQSYTMHKHWQKDVIGKNVQAHPMELCSPPFVLLKTSTTIGWSPTFQPLSPNLNVNVG